jgi:hypothetical protein
VQSDLWKTSLKKAEVVNDGKYHQAVRAAVRRKHALRRLAVSLSSEEKLSNAGSEISH